MEDTFWNTLRALDESVILMQHMAGHLQQEGHEPGAAQFTQQAAATRQRADVIRQLVMKHPTRLPPLLTENAPETSEARGLPDHHDKGEEASVKPRHKLARQPWWYCGRRDEWSGKVRLCYGQHNGVPLANDCAAREQPVVARAALPLLRDGAVMRSPWCQRYPRQTLPGSSMGMQRCSPVGCPLSTSCPPEVKRGETVLPNTLDETMCPLWAACPVPALPPPFPPAIVLSKASGKDESYQSVSSPEVGKIIHWAK
jgi:hypothetical protein